MNLAQRYTTPGSSYGQEASTGFEGFMSTHGLATLAAVLLYLGV